MKHNGTVIDGKGISLFISVVDHKGIRSAANQTGIPVATISRRVRALEKQLGVPLIDRNSPGFALTDAGYVFYGKVHDPIQELQDIQQSFISGEIEPEGRVYLTAPEHLVCDFLVPVIAQIECTFPAVRIELIVSDARLDLLEASIDIAIRAGDPGVEGYKNEVLFNAPRIICASESYLERHGSPRTVADLHRHRWIGIRQRDKPMRIVFSDNESVDLAVDPVIQVNTQEVALRLCKAGSGMAYLPSPVCGEALRSRELMQLFSGRKPQQNLIYLLTRQRFYTPASVRVIADSIRNAAMGVQYLRTEAQV